MPRKKTPLNPKTIFAQLREDLPAIEAVASGALRGVSLHRRIPDAAAAFGSIVDQIQAGRADMAWETFQHFLRERDSRAQRLRDAQQIVEGRKRGRARQALDHNPSNLTPAQRQIRDEFSAQLKADIPRAEAVKRTAAKLQCTEDYVRKTAKKLGL